MAAVRRGALGLRRALLCRWGARGTHKMLRYTVGSTVMENRPANALSPNSLATRPAAM